MCNVLLYMSFHKLNAHAKKKNDDIELIIGYLATVGIMCRRHACKNLLTEIKKNKSKKKVFLFKIVILNRNFAR